MADIELYHYARCSSCRDAETVLAERGAALVKRDLFEERLSVDEIAVLFARIGRTAQEMLAIRSRPYQQLGLGGLALSDGEIVELMAEYPALVRRPIVVAGRRGQVGFSRAAIERL